MALFDMPLEQLKKYNPAEKAPADFDAFWKKTLAESAKFPVDPHYVQLTDKFYKLVDVYDVTFKGYMGQSVKGWFLEPAGNVEPLPCIVQYQGYGGGRSLAIDHMLLPTAGFALFFMDTRGQGSSWSVGDTPDNVPESDGGQGPQIPGFMTKGIQSREAYYYRRVFVDAVRAIEAAASHPHVDPDRIAVTGGSQGGGITIAAAGLAGKQVKVCMPDVPFLCNYRRAITLNDSYPYQEIAQYLKNHRGRTEEVHKVLSYFDGMHFAARITARSLFSTGLMDTVCPPSTVFAAYNRVKAKKDIKVYDFNNHEGGGPFHAIEKLKFATQWL